MSLEDALLLQETAFQAYPELGISIRTFGDNTHPDYACYGEDIAYFFWTLDDWHRYVREHQKRLQWYTEEGSRLKKERQRAAMLKGWQSRNRHPLTTH